MKGLLKQRRVIFSIALAVILSMFSLVLAQGAVAADRKPVKNIIYLIGDGMGPSQVGLTRYYSLFVLGKELNMTKVMNRGSTAYMTNYSANYIVTDSAAAGTALATGQKTNNRMISMTPNGIPLITIIEKARDMGKSTGLVSTTRLTHATPASFAAHHANRDAENEIAEQLIKSNVTVMLAGGWRHFVPQSVKGSKRKDDRDLLAEAKKEGYTVVKNTDEFNAVNPEAGIKLLGLFSKSHRAYEMDRDPAKEPSIADTTRKAIEILRTNPKGFILMVEGGRIDHASHQSDAAGTVNDTLAFDKAVGIALEYVEEDPNTLVVVTADHETGGLTITRGQQEGEKLKYMSIEDLRKISKVKHSIEDVIAKEAKKAPDTAAIIQIIKQNTNIDITEAEAQNIKEGKAWLPVYGRQPGNWIGRALEDELKVNFAGAEHSAEPLMLFAVGPFSEQFRGFLDNTDPPKIMSKALNTGY